MEQNRIKSVWLNRLQEAKDKNEFIKLTFKYADNDYVTFKRGRVLDVFEDGFNFKEIYDGEVSYAFQFIIEIKPSEERK